MTEIEIKTKNLQSALSTLSHHNAAEGYQYEHERPQRIEAQNLVKKCARELFLAGGDPSQVLKDGNFLAQPYDLGFYSWIS